MRTHPSSSMETFATLLFLLSLSLLSAGKISLAATVDTLTTNQTLRDGQTIASSGGNFEVGFFSPGNSRNRYVGIWYKNLLPVQTVIWVANRESPVPDTSGELMVTPPGILVLVYGKNVTVWSSNTTQPARNPIARILDSGNLVVMDSSQDDPNNNVWQTFDHPGDTLVPGMKLGVDYKRGLKWYVTSWKTNDDPAPGDYTYQLDPTGIPQGLIKQGSNETFRVGSWNGDGFSGMPNLGRFPNIHVALINDGNQLYYDYEVINNSVISRFILNPRGIAQRIFWDPALRSWQIYLSAPIDYCDTYSQCGPNGLCNINNAPICGCLSNFVGKENDEGGFHGLNRCKRRTPLNCEGDGFIKYTRVKLPDTRLSWSNKTMSLDECRIACLHNCNCTAYSNLDVRGTGCLLWFGDLLDIRVMADITQDFYVRMASSDLIAATLPGSSEASGKRKQNVITKVVLPIVIGMALLGLSLAVYFWRKKIRSMVNGESRVKENLQLPLFRFSTISNATNSFTNQNKLGEGGFGQVYKGVLEDGQEIAVKRLSKDSGQGTEEFKAELVTISKLQHRNLVKLLGYSIHAEEKMLIYEYMPNKSLDSFIFDSMRKKYLDWPKRFGIIHGIARGLLYLHQDSRLRIIHRDLKAGNILLDHDMNPKISDFGLAKSFGGNETGAKTDKVVGTFGYISPEYQAKGSYSVKSDVFSFGVLVLEIVSGKRNREFSHQGHSDNLIGHARRLYERGTTIELIDETLAESYNMSEVIRAIHVGLLSVQQSPEDRPSMSYVVPMLNGERALPHPKEPIRPEELQAPQGDPSKTSTAMSANEVTVTLLYGR